MALPPPPCCSGYTQGVLVQIAKFATRGSPRRRSSLVLCCCWRCSLGLRLSPWRRRSSRGLGQCTETRVALPKRAGLESRALLCAGLRHLSQPGLAARLAAFCSSLSVACGGAARGSSLLVGAACPHCLAITERRGHLVCGRARVRHSGLRSARTFGVHDGRAIQACFTRELLVAFSVQCGPLLEPRPCGGVREVSLAPMGLPPRQHTPSPSSVATVYTPAHYPTRLEG
jgi:hypothetical protein